MGKQKSKGHEARPFHNKARKPLDAASQKCWKNSLCRHGRDAALKAAAAKANEPAAVFPFLD
jgi:hypothetical protein